MFSFSISMCFLFQYRFLMVMHFFPRLICILSHLFFFNFIVQYWYAFSIILSVQSYSIFVYIIFQHLFVGNLSQYLGAVFLRIFSISSCKLSEYWCVLSTLLNAHSFSFLCALFLNRDIWYFSISIFSTVLTYLYTIFFHLIVNASYRRGDKGYAV